MTDLRAAVLIAGCAVFGAIIVAEIRANAGGDAPAVEAPARASAAPAAERAHPPPLDNLIATSLARPLFSPTRQPPESVAANGPSGPDLNDKRLAGIVIEPDRRLAIFAVNGAKPLVLSEGESVNGWQIERITATAVSLRSQSGTKTLQPKMDPNLVRQPRVLRPVQPAAATGGPREAPPAALPRFYPAPQPPAAAPPAPPVPPSGHGAVLPRRPGPPGEH